MMTDERHKLTHNNKMSNSKGTQLHNEKKRKIVLNFGDKTILLIS